MHIFSLRSFWVFDARGHCAAPGFIDAHRHGDAFVFRPGYGEMQIRQGVTTTINGNCGLSIAPCPARRRGEILQYLKPITGALPENTDFETFGGYLGNVEQRPSPSTSACTSGAALCAWSRAASPPAA